MDNLDVMPYEQIMNSVHAAVKKVVNIVEHILKVHLMVLYMLTENLI